MCYISINYLNQQGSFPDAFQHWYDNDNDKQSWHDANFVITVKTTTCRLSLWQWRQSWHHENWRLCLKWPRVQQAEMHNQGTVSIWRSSLWKAARILIICGLTSIGFPIIKIRPIKTLSSLQYWNYPHMVDVTTISWCWSVKTKLI